MRLIDADAFIEYLGLDIEDSREINLSSPVSLEDFDRQPTVYDVDKVVEQLEDRLCSSLDEEHDLQCALRNGHFRDAIEIVKKGGTNENQR